MIGGGFLIVFDTWRLSRLRRRLRHEIGAADQPVDVDVIAPAGGLADSPAHERKLA